MLNANETAKQFGFTREIIAESNEYTMHLLVSPDADLEGEFKAWCCDEQETLYIDGWQFYCIEDVAAA